MTPLPTSPPNAEARRELPIGIAGAGRLGIVLAGALAAAGYTRLRLASRAEDAADRAAGALGISSATVPALVEDCALVFLAVPDRVVASLAMQQSWQAGQAVVHLSGALGLDVLAGAADRGAVPGGLHPIQTFPAIEHRSREDAAARFRGVTCGIEAAAPLGPLLEGIAADLGARTVRLEGVNRALYHAAAVLVSNDVVALMAAAARAWEAAGLPADASREALAPLLLATAANVARLPLAEALTGPVARGDVETVRRHLAALGSDEGLAATYRVLGREVLRLGPGHVPDVRAALEALLAAE